MRFLSICFIAGLLLSSACSQGRRSEIVSPSPSAVTVPFRGNVFVSETSGDLYGTAPAVIDTYSGKLLSWNQPSQQLSLFFRTSKAGRFTLEFQASLPEGTSSASLSFSCEGKTEKLALSSSGTFLAGEFVVEKPGYVRVDIRGGNAVPSGAAFPRISYFYVSGPAIENAKLNYVPAEKVEDCYWYRRGPSVHLFYEFPSADVEWFYNEAEVPEGADIPATYYMLTGFSEGYMGIQTHTGGPNTVLFSVWSPYQTDNPGSIPADMRIQTLRKGEGVTAQDFGGEGSGGQSFMDYPWKPGTRYSTLVRVHPNGDGTTDYTGYFRGHDGVWRLLASFRRPKTNTWYKGAYSFLECFDPNTSIHPRRVLFGNQWVRLTDGTWQEVTRARFSCDNTGRQGMRADLYGALEGNDFLLQNCGFFAESTEYGVVFSRPSGGNRPEIDFDQLEKL